MGELEEGIKRIKESERGTPPRERDYLDLVKESTRQGGIDAATFDSHRTGRINGGIACDVSSGPCRCGAWH